MTKPCDLFTKIPREELNRLFEESYAGAELDFSYLGFEEIYQKVLEVAPPGMVILDLGCAYATQSWYFRDHKEYIGVDYGACMKKNPTYEDNLKCVIHTENSRYFFEPIQTFIKETLPTLGLDLNNVFAVCSAVPDKEARQLMKDTFLHYLDWYPGEEMQIVWNNEIVKQSELDWLKCKKNETIKDVVDEPDMELDADFE